MSPILSRTINFCWFCFKWSLAVAVIAGGAAALHFYQQIDEEIRRQVETKFAQHYVDLKISLASAQRVEGKGIVVRGLTIVEPGAEGPRAELLSIEEMFLDCTTDLQELATKDPEVCRVTIRRPTLRTTRRPDGTFSVAKLLPLPRFGEYPPEVVVEGATIEIFDPLKTPASTMVLRDVNLTLSPTMEGEPGVASNAMQVHGMLMGDHFRRIEFRGMVNPRASTFSISGNVEGLDISPELCASVPEPLCTKLKPCHALRGQGALDFNLTYDPVAPTPLRYDLTGQLKQGRLDDPRLPHPLTDIQAAVHADNAGFSIKSFTAHSNQTTLSGTCSRSGYDPTSPFTLTAEVRQLELERSLMDILPPSLQEQWRNYSPKGQIDADVQLDYDGKDWRPEISIRCLKVSFAYRKFLYRMEYGQGTVKWKSNVLKLDMTAYAGSDPVALTAEMAVSDSKPVGWFELRGSKVQVDKTLIDALPEKSQAVVRSFDPRGSVSLHFRMWRDRPDEPFHKHLRIAPDHCSICYDNFPYPITNIQGLMEMIDETWRFTNLEGSRNSARVTCNGQLAQGLQGNELVLNLDAKEVPLDDELCGALKPNIQQVWRDLRPRGMIDLSAEIRYLTEERKHSISLCADPHPNCTSIEPVRFPYRLEKLQGALIYRDGHVTLGRPGEKCRAEHGATKMTYQGECDFQSDGRWNMKFTDLAVDGLRPDHDLIRALPDQLKKAIVGLNLTSSMNLRGSLNFERDGLPEEPLKIQWNTRVFLHQASLRCGEIPLTNITGDVTLVGGFDHRQVLPMHSVGALNLDSLNFKDCFLTKVRGPIWIEEGRVLFGTSIDSGNVRPGPDVPAGPPRPVTAEAFAGTIQGGGWVLLGPEVRYALSVDLLNADLGRTVHEITGVQQRLAGRIEARTRLSGSGPGRNALSGDGILQLTDANVYELPVMLSLLKILSIQIPNANAFSSATVNYHIQGEHIYFNPINFNGDAISLRGKGEMSLQGDVRLKFYPIVGRGELGIPLVTPLLRGASQQVMLIYVKGTLEKPEVEKQVFPGVQEALQQLQTDVQTRR